MADTLTFYIEILGFDCMAYDESVGWARLSKDDAEIMLSLPNEHERFQGPGFSGSFYINVDEVDKLWEELKNKVRVCYPIENFSYGMREFAIYDNNGYILQFGQELNQA